MNVLLIGNGGREHAIACQLVASPLLQHLFVAPGNGGTAILAKTTNVPIAATAVDALLEFAQQKTIDLTVVGPEAPLVAGVVDRFQAVGLPIFGPTQAAAQIEGSKAFSKLFMQRHDIPTGRAEIFDDFDDAMRCLRQLDAVPVIKASGLAAGKGVILTSSREAAAAAIGSMLLEHRFGDAGNTVLLEERLSGPEVSVLAFTDGQHVRIMPPAQDYKRLLDGNDGPNTGGMGAFAPSLLLSPQQLAEIEQKILLPTIRGLAQEGTPFVGVLYAGIMLTAQGPRTLEFNCRLGDPETQVLLPLLDSDLLAIFVACTTGRLDQANVRWRSESAATVVMAAQGYPDDYATGHEITGIDQATAAGCSVYQAGTKYKDNRLVTAGGRVLAVSALGHSIEHAAHRAYDGVKLIHFNEAQYRRDIGLPKGLVSAKAKKSRPKR